MRIFWEVDVRAVSPNSTTTRMRDIALRNRTLENPSQCEGFETKEKERETFCVRFGKQNFTVRSFGSAMASSTTRLLARTQLLVCEKSKLHLEKNKTLRGVLSMPLYSMKEGKYDEQN